MDTFLSVLIRPFTALALFGLAAIAAWGLKKAMPEGRIKAVLYRKHAIIPDTEEERRDWTAPVGMLLGSALLFWWILWLNGDL